MNSGAIMPPAPVDDLAVPVPPDLADELELKNVAGRLVGVAGNPGAHRAAEDAALPPRRIEAGQVASHLVGASHGLADAVAGHEAALAVDLARGEMLEVLGVEVARERPIVGEEPVEAPELLFLLLNLERACSAFTVLRSRP
jgi:hypothetical protein